MLARLCHRWLALATSVSREELQPHTYALQKSAFHLDAQNWFFRKKPPMKTDSKKSADKKDEEKPKTKEGVTEKLVHGKTFKIVGATTEDRDDVLKLLKSSFYGAEPLMGALGLVGGRVPPEFDEYILVDLCENMSLLAVGCLLDEVRGFAINATLTRYRKPVDPEMVRSVGPCMRLLLRIWEYLEVTSNLPDTLGASRIFEIRYLGTHPQFARRGIALELAKESLVLAKAKGYKVACMFATSMFSKKVAEKLGMHVVWVMPWSEFKDAKGNQIVTVPHPHTHAYVLAKELGPFDKYDLTC